METIRNQGDFDGFGYIALPYVCQELIPQSLPLHDNLVRTLDHSRGLNNTFLMNPKDENRFDFEITC